MGDDQPIVGQNLRGRTWYYGSGSPERYAEAVRKYGPSVQFQTFLPFEMPEFQRFSTSEDYLQSLRDVNNAQVEHLGNMAGEASRRSKVLSRGALIRMAPTAAASFLSGINLDMSDARQIQEFARQASERKAMIEAAQDETKLVGSARVEAEVQRLKDFDSRENFNREQEYNFSKAQADHQNAVGASGAAAASASQQLADWKWAQMLGQQEEEARLRAANSGGINPFMKAYGEIHDPIENMRNRIQSLLGHAEEDIKDPKGMFGWLGNLSKGLDNRDDEEMEQIGSAMIDDFRLSANKVLEALGTAKGTILEKTGDMALAEQMVAPYRQFVEDLRHQATRFETNGFSRETVDAFTQNMSKYDDLLGQLKRDATGGIEKSFSATISAAESDPDVQKMMEKEMGGKPKPTSSVNAPYAIELTQLREFDYMPMAKVEEILSSAMSASSQNGGVPVLNIGGRTVSGSAALLREFRQIKREHDAKYERAKNLVSYSTAMKQFGELVRGGEYDASKITIKSSDEGKTRLGDFTGKIVVTVPHPKGGRDWEGTFVSRQSAEQFAEAAKIYLGNAR